MAHAWLDSLSEDWASQPRSGDSVVKSPVGSLPSLSNSVASSEASYRRSSSSRVPRPRSSKQSLPKSHSYANLPLSERNTNHPNIPAQSSLLRKSSKLGQEVQHHGLTTRASRASSASTTASVQHHTVQHRSLSSSPQKPYEHNEAPEWKRRLLHGEVGYGEQRDLFSPAGLETLFKPPVAQHDAPAASPVQLQADSTMPSSPPPYTTDSELHPKSSCTTVPVNSQKEMGPSVMRYRIAEDNSDPFPDEDLSRSSNFRRALPKVRRSSWSGIQGNDLPYIDEYREPQIEDGFQPSDRVMSGHSDNRHEDFTPILLNHRDIVGQGNNYADNAQAGAVLTAHNAPAYLSYQLHQLEHDGNSSSLPHFDDELPTGGSFREIGDFVNFGRGGDSDDGSFRARMLSPSSLPHIDESDMLQNASIQASTPKKAMEEEETATHLPTILEPEPPVTPGSQSDHNSPADVRPSSGSPLKLFGDYDTFTNQKLLRRLSQFESAMHGSGMDASLSHGKEGETLGMNEAYIGASSAPRNVEPLDSNSSSSSKGVSFGAGKLDHFEFNEEQLDSSRIVPQSSHSMVAAHLLPSFGFEKWAAAETHLTRTRETTTRRVVTIRSSKRRPSANISLPAHPVEPTLPEVPDTPRKHYGENESKRLPRSPPKNPTPKRRRTIHTLEVPKEHVNEAVAPASRESHDETQSVAGRKRKDARHGEAQAPANAQVLALRQILRPRTPSQTQRLQQSRTNEDTSDYPSPPASQEELARDKNLARVQAELDLTVSGKLSSANAVGQPMQTESRKGSVTTQDFLDEAKKIMAGIRSKARPGSALASLDESESESDREKQRAPDVDLDSYQDSTMEPFSRPPSREGAPLPRPIQRQEDPEVIDHLRKYEEISDLDGIVTSSLKSIRLAQEAITAANELNQKTEEVIHSRSGSADLCAEHQNLPPSIEVTDYANLHHKRKHSTSSIGGSNEELDEAEFPTQGSNASHSTTRSIPTGSSGGSGSRRVIEPEKVSHLIPQEIAGMVFDHERKMWVKTKKVLSPTAGAPVLQDDESDEDPFGDIPDLTVDEVQELQRIQALAAGARAEAMLRAAEAIPNRLPSVEDLPQDDLPVQKQAFAVDKGPHGTPQTVEKEAVEDLGAVEHEISIHESRFESNMRTSRRRNVTITFSSPVASIIPPEDHFGHEEEDVLDFYGTANRLRQSTGQRTVSSEHEEDDLLDLYGTANRTRQSAPRPRVVSASGRPIQQTPSRKISLGMHAFMARPVSRIDERNEEVISHPAGNGSRQTSLSLFVTPRPIRTSPHDIQILPSAGHSVRNDSILQLTPLSDFTLNQQEESFALEVSCMGPQYRQQYTAKGQRVLSLSVKDLVQGITDVEPYEPYWEDMRQLNLHGKNLQSAHMLSKFCGSLEALDISNNKLGQLDGLPSSIRNLRVTNNCLSDLCGWSQLYNLQYIDVSNNQLTSLEAFKSLVHLRGIRADNNQISSLDGVMNLDGLISLRLRGNLVEDMDFTDSRLQRLTDLDLKGNRVQRVHGLEALHSLTTLNLEDNELSSSVHAVNSQSPSLKYLKISGNKLSHLDISMLPNLRLLYADRNRLSRVGGLSKVKHLDSLSLREQQGNTRIDPSFINECFEVRKLFLSGNLLTTFAPTVDFLNLQYLELANCGLESLLEDFGELTANLRILNLNFNALQDLKPLLGIVRLKKLLVAGNRLTRLRRTATVLSCFPCLTKADVRNNPLTLGFYPLVQDKQLVVQKVDSENGEDDGPKAFDPFTLEAANADSDTAYSARLDLQTRMRRRVYEILVLGGCARLKVLDGLPVDRAAMMVKDRVWEELVEAGIVFGGQPAAEVNADDACAEAKVEDADKGGSTTAVEEVTERWLAEDSFA